ncbi:hypothetical protein BB559_006465 [Furculomyces boomerangus]|uniref:Uncharacterized protein n=1 Tax=Furculomyces boomerangus TaxID=61424 RepID=A0A2T9Y2Q5_9FUNG|nr:hypothetical protein BB559_006465 [Furculomyces boomerangus]
MIQKQNNNNPERNALMERVFEKKWASFKRPVLNLKTKTLGKRPPPTGNWPSSFKLSPAKPSSSKHSESLDEQWKNWGKKRKQAPEPQPAWIAPPPTRVWFIDPMVDIRVRGYSRVSTGDIKKDLRKAGFDMTKIKNISQRDGVVIFTVMATYQQRFEEENLGLFQSMDQFSIHFVVEKEIFQLLIMGILKEVLSADNFSKDELYIIVYKDLMKVMLYKDEKETKVRDGYLSQINKTILDLTNLFHEKPLVFNPSFLIVKRELPKSSLKPQKNKKIQELEEPFQQPNNTFKNEQRPKTKRSKIMRVESLLNED